MPAVAIVGGGVAGVSAAKQLASHGVHVALYERAAHLGGRLGASKLLAGAGTTYIKPKHPLFAAQMEQWLVQGAARQWDVGVPHKIHEPFGTSTPDPESKPPHTIWWVGSPAMPRLAELTAVEQEEVEVRIAEVGSIARDGNSWCIRDTQDTVLGQHSLLICAVPVGVARRLLPAGVADGLLPRAILAEDYEKARYGAAFRFKASLQLPFRFGMVPTGSAVTVLLNDSSRRNDSGCEADGKQIWVVQTATDYAKEKLDEGVAPDTVAEELLGELAKLLGRDMAGLPQCEEMAAVSWVYGDGDYEIAGHCVWSQESRLALAGDWCGNGRVEAAFMSGYAAAAHALEWLGVAMQDDVGLAKI